MSEENNEASVLTTGLESNSQSPTLADFLKGDPWNHNTKMSNRSRHVSTSNHTRSGPVNWAK